MFVGLCTPRKCFSTLLAGDESPLDIFVQVWRAGALAVVESSSTDNAKFTVAPALNHIEENTDCMLVMLANLREDIWDTWQEHIKGHKGSYDKSC